MHEPQLYFQTGIQVSRSSDRVLVSNARHTRPVNVPHSLYEELVAKIDVGATYDDIERLCVGQPEIQLRLFDADILSYDPNGRSYPYRYPKDLCHKRAYQFRRLFDRYRFFTMVSPALAYAAYDGVAYLAKNRIPGDVVLTGVWRGGLAALLASHLRECNDLSRKIRLFDTFDWTWPAPSQHDGTMYGRGPEETRAFVARQAEAATDTDHGTTVAVSRTQVARLMASTGYPMEQVVFYEGYTQDTLQSGTDDSFALAYLDTDFYESTKHELGIVYPALVTNGLLLIDDYPTELGAQKAVDEFFADEAFVPHMTRIDYQGRLIVKPSTQGSSQ